MKLLLTILILISCSCQQSNEAKYSNLVKVVGIEYDIQPSLALALVKVESDFNPKAVSYKGAKGIAQVMFKDHKERCKLKNENELFYPMLNLHCGFSYFQECKREYNGNITNALACYNAGYRGSQKGLGFGYAKKVLKRQKYYEKQVKN